jgi:outer membrane protein
MKVRLHSVVKMLVIAAATAAAAGASAQSAGQWTVKLGVNKITPKVESGDISAPALPGAKGDVGPDTQPVLVFNYGLTDNISAELDLGTPYTHKIYGAGSIAMVGQVGTVQALPPTAFIQYRFFQPSSMVRPYVGVGLTYAYFRKATGSGKLTLLTNPGGEPTTFKLDNKLAGSLQAGVVLNLGERWFVDAAVVKTYLKTTAHFSTNQYQDMTLNPQSVSVGVGYKF